MLPVLQEFSTYTSIYSYVLYKCSYVLYKCSEQLESAQAISSLTQTALWNGRGGLSGYEEEEEISGASSASSGRSKTVVNEQHKNGPDASSRERSSSGILSELRRRVRRSAHGYGVAPIPACNCDETEDGAHSCVLNF